MLAIWEGPIEVRVFTVSLKPYRPNANLLQFKIYIVTLAGDLLGSFTPEPDRGLGIRSVTWHPSGSYLVVAGWDDKVMTRILGTLSRTDGEA